MARVEPLKRLRLSGFNNLTKSLSFNLYDVSWAKTADEKQAYLSYIDEEYNADRLTEILTEVTKIIGANVLNVARQDYDPQGASVTILISEGGSQAAPLAADGSADQAGNPIGDAPTATGDSVVAHLDKSHICVHTYPESHPDDGICTFRADIEVSTCGTVSPLHALNYLIREFDSDVLSLDYRVRGFTRDVAGKKHYIDHRITSIQNFVEREILDHYHAIDVNVYQENLFHTKLMWKKVDLDRYLFGGAEARKALPLSARRRVKRRLAQEIQEIFYARNVG